MANNTIAARVQLRYDTYSRWMVSDVILFAGEIAVAAFPYSKSIANTDITPENTPPAIGIKVGDGVHYFYELPWLQAVAADVYEWAKSDKKPTYSATEISGLADYIQQYAGGGGSGGSASTAYQIIYDSSTNKYILQYFDDTTNEWINTSSEINLSNIITRLNNIERWANGARTNLGNIELPMIEYIYGSVLDFLSTLDYNDEAVEHQFVTQVTEVDGQIEVLRSPLSAEDITTGVLPTERGGTGITFVDDDELLVGSLEGTLTKRKFVTEIMNQRDAFATVGAIKDYVLDQTAGLTGAMHFIGESTLVITNGSNINPQIIGYNFNEAQPGDVILANNAQEFVWTGTNWHLLGDEVSYAIKGSIKDADIHAEAAIQQSKIDGLVDALNNKVDKIAGKTLTSNDFTDELKNKLDTIAEGAQVNVIEHISVNGNEYQPVAKSVNLLINEFDANSRAKLSEIAEGAEVNKIEKIVYGTDEIVPDENRIVTITPDPHTEHINKIEQIFINGIEQPINAQKQVKITIDQAALNLNVLEGATVPDANGTRVDVAQVQKKLELETIAQSGNVKDLRQTTDTYIILNCGNSTEVI